jgi:hypothetical protein
MAHGTLFDVAVYLHKVPVRLEEFYHIPDRERLTVVKIIEKN